MSGPETHVLVLCGETGRVSGKRLASIRRRFIGLLVASGAAVILGIALSLTPNPAGHGTHLQLGLMPECNWVARFDVPCPTCGMTTAFSHAVRGQFPSALHAQPFGFLLSIVTACAGLIGLYVLATGAQVGGIIARLWGGRTIAFLIGALIAAWAYKIITFREIIG